MTEDTNTPSPRPSSPLLPMGQLAGSGPNPAMVYRPLTPPLETSRLNRFIGNDNDDEHNPRRRRRRFKLEISLLTAWRFVIWALTLTTIILWIDIGVVERHHSELLFLVVWLFFILLWNFFFLLTGLTSGRGRRPRRGRVVSWLPTLACQVGNWGCAVNDDDDDDDDHCDDDDNDGNTRSRRAWRATATATKRKKFPVVWIVDVVLGLIPVVIAATSYQYTDFWYRHSRMAVEALIFTVGSFEWVAAFLSLFSLFRNYVMEIGIVFRKKNRDDDDEGEEGQAEAVERYYRIQLPVDNDHHRTAGGTAAVSVAA